MTRLIIEEGRTAIILNLIDKDNEMEVSMMDKDGNKLGLLFLSASNLKSIQEYISTQMQESKPLTP